MGVTISAEVIRLIRRTTHFDELGRRLDPRVGEIRDVLAGVRTARLMVGYTVPYVRADQAVVEWVDGLWAAEGLSGLLLRSGGDC